MAHIHVHRRETTLGRWLPVGLYVANTGLTAITAAGLGAWNLLWPGIFPIAVLGVYLWRIQRIRE